MIFLIFGSTGFIGKNLMLFLKSQGEEVYGVSRSEAQDSFKVDIANKEDFAKINVKPDVVVNCASALPINGNYSKDTEYLEELFLTNVIGGTNIANWAREKKVSKIINCSTLAVVGKPWPIEMDEEFYQLPSGFHVGYSMSKIAQERIMNNSIEGSDCCLLHLRLSAVYGLGMVEEGIIFQLLEKGLKNENVKLTNSRLVNVDLIHVNDVVRSIYKVSLATFNQTIESYNLASGREISIYDLSCKILSLVGSESSIIEKNDSEMKASKAKIKIEKLKKVIGEDVFESFISIDEGLIYLLKSSIKNH